MLTIVEQLKTDPNFITKDVEKDDYYKYIEFLDQYQSTFNSTKKIIHISDYIKSKNKTFQKVKIKKHKKKKEDDAMQKITEKEKIVENDDEIDEKLLKIINPLIFKKLNYNSKKLVIDAEKNVANSIFIVSKNFIEGTNNFPKDIETGIKYLEYGLTVDNVESIEYFGKLLFDGDIIQKNEERSVEILTKAVNDFNSASAKYELANIILSHQSFDVDDTNENINYFLAKKYSKEVADNGNVKAMLLYFKLAQMEKKNKFGEIHHDENEKLKYIKLAAECNDPEGLARYGNYLEYGNVDMKPNPNEAVKFYKMSYDLNDMTGCAFLGLAFLNGIGDLEKNEEYAKKLLKISSDSQNIYGMIYYYINIIKDQTKTFEVSKKAAEMGSSFGYYVTGLSYMNGKGVEKDINMAIKYYKRGFEEGSLGSAYNLGYIYRTGQPEFEIKRNVKKAKRYLKYAADNGYMNAINQYPQLLAEIGESPEEIKKYFKIGIRLGDTSSMVLYSAHLNLGNGIPQDFTKAAKYSKMAADLGDKNGMKIYASLLTNGLGVEKNKEEAQRYCLLASEQFEDNCLIQ